MRNNYVLIDFESVQPESLAALDHEQFKVLVFVGASQAKVPFELATAMQRRGGSAEYVKIAGNGRNALDFHIAFYIGQLAAADATARFHIISKDAGFDPLIQHLKTKGMFAARTESIDEIPLVKAANSKFPEERLNMVIGRLQQLNSAKPRKLKTLSSTIASLFQKQLPEEEVASLVQTLQARGWVTVTDNKVTYALPQPG